MTRLPHGALPLLSKITGYKTKILSEYISGSKKPGGDRSLDLEDKTGISNRIWRKGTPEERRQLVMNFIDSRFDA